MLVEVQYQGGAKEVFRLSKSSIIIGRSKQSDIVLSYPGISRQHFKLELEKGEFYVTDLGSTNGVFVNNEKIATNERVNYKNFLPLVIGETVFTVSNDEQVEMDQKVSSKPSNFDYDKKSSSASSSASESTKILTRNVKKGTNKKSSSSNLVSNILVGLLLIGGAGAYYYFDSNKVKKNTDELAENPDNNKSEAATTGEKKGKKAKGKNKGAEFTFDEAAIYSSIWEKPGCHNEEEKRLCPIVKKDWKEKESLYVTSKGIFIFIDLGEEVKNKEQSYPFFSKLPIFEKVEMVLSYYVTHPLLFSEAGEKHLPIVAIGFEKKDVVISIKYATQSNSKYKLGLTPDQQNALFSRAFLGETYEYKQYLKPIIETIEL